MALRTITWRRNLNKGNLKIKMRGLIGEFELFLIEERQFKNDTDNRYMLTVRLGRSIRIKGETPDELVDFSKKYYNNFLRTLGIREEEIK